MATMMSMNRWLHQQPSRWTMLKSGSAGSWSAPRSCELTKDGGKVHTWLMCACTHFPERKMFAPRATWTERRRVAEAGENCPLLPGGSRTITHPDMLTHSHSVQKRKRIQGDTNSPGTWPLTLLRCSEVNSLSCLNKPLQLAVVNPQLKNRNFASIASFSTHRGGVGVGGGIKMKVFIALQ